MNKFFISTLVVITVFNVNSFSIPFEVTGEKLSVVLIGFLIVVVEISSESVFFSPESEFFSSESEFLSSESFIVFLAKNFFYYFLKFFF